VTLLSIGDAVIITDLEGRIVLMNSESRRGDIQMMRRNIELETRLIDELIQFPSRSLFSKGVRSLHPAQVKVSAQNSLFLSRSSKVSLIERRLRRRQTEARRRKTGDCEFCSLKITSTARQ